MNYISKKRWNESKVVSEECNENYLTTIERVINDSLDDYPRILAVRFDLRLPESNQDDYLDRDLPDSFNRDKLIPKFIESLKSKIKYDLKRKNKKWDRNFKCKLRYVWCREKESSNNEHYHVMIIINKDVYRSIGEYHHNGSLSSMIVSAWESSLSLDYNQVKRLVYFPSNCAYVVNYRDSKYEEQYDDLFYRVSYLAKTRTKNINRYYRSFGCSTR
ncbi:inovirus Gp2 family protein [Photobacterium phosphoreum]|uniref:inovirus Gp2 family protein n=1 Tax=Photobacterium phosphoreum TaxID=659 RepID=UPI001E4F8886|nr:inovirus Gp2 family protein [Photobacterium phosphoreum]MCD9501978.1 inovirus Gp2 family protein [Photobacterium phosphoreum]